MRRLVPWESLLALPYPFKIPVTPPWESCWDGAEAQECSLPPGQRRKELQLHAVLQTVAITCLQNTQASQINVWIVFM